MGVGQGVGQGQGCTVAMCEGGAGFYNGGLWGVDSLGSGPPKGVTLRGIEKLLSYIRVLIGAVASLLQSVAWPFRGFS